MVRRAESPLQWATMADHSAGSPAPPFRALWFRVLRVRGVGIYIDPTILLALAALVLAVGGSFVLAFILVGCVLVHEIGHAIAARWCGLAVNGIYLHVVALAWVQRGRPRDDLLVSLAGPLASAALAGALLLVPRSAPLPAVTDLGAWFADPLRAAICCNLLMSAVNLLPLVPADGGRAVQALFRMRLPPAGARAGSSAVNTAIGIAIVAVGIRLQPAPAADGLFVLGLAACLFGWREARTAVRLHRLARDEHIQDAG